MCENADKVVNSTLQVHEYVGTRYFLTSPGIYTVV